MKTLQLSNVVWQEGEFYVAQCLNVDVSSFGESRQEALNNLHEALELYFEDAPNDAVQAVSGAEIVTDTVQYA